MHREPLKLLLRRYASRWADEAALAARFLEFVDQHADCLLRSCAVGHVTASAWVVDHAHVRSLLLRHRKLGKWLQPGGHVDGQAELQRAAAREVREESGLVQLQLASWHGELVPLDLDVHAIPARPAEPSHLHWDVRFLLRAGPGQALVGSDEALAVRWCEAGELPALTTEDSVLRLYRKAAAWLPGCGWLPA